VCRAKRVAIAASQARPVPLARRVSRPRHGQRRVRAGRPMCVQNPACHHCSELSTSPGRAARATRPYRAPPQAAGDRAGLPMCVPRPARCDHSEPRMSPCRLRDATALPPATGGGGPRRWAAHHRPCVCRARRVAIAASRACPHRFTRSHLHCVKRFLITGAPGTRPFVGLPQGGDSGSGLRPEPESALTVAVCPCSLSHGNRRDSLRLPTAPPADPRLRPPRSRPGSVRDVRERPAADGRAGPLRVRKERPEKSFLV
jgi:hypothetical protein